MRAFRSIAVAMALMAFLSQALGAAILPTHCDMSGSNSSIPAADMAGMDHSAHVSGADGIDPASGKKPADCCDPDGDCTMGSCVSVSLCPQFGFISHSRFASPKPRLDVVSLTTPFIASPYRPPIFH